jgi:hypothetical protein
MDFFDEYRVDQKKSERIKRLLRDAQQWCQAKRGRQSRLALYLGVAPQRLSGWFSENKKRRPRLGPTGAQALSLNAFLVEERKRNYRPLP